MGNTRSKNKFKFKLHDIDGSNNVKESISYFKTLVSSDKSMNFNQMGLLYQHPGYGGGDAMFDKCAYECLTIAHFNNLCNAVKNPSSKEYACNALDLIKELGSYFEKHYQYDKAVRCYEETNSFDKLLKIYTQLYIYMNQTCYWEDFSKTVKSIIFSTELFRIDELIPDCALLMLDFISKSSHRNDDLVISCLTYLKLASESGETILFDGTVKYHQISAKSYFYCVECVIEELICNNKLSVLYSESKYCPNITTYLKFMVPHCKNNSTQPHVQKIISTLARYDKQRNNPKLIFTLVKLFHNKGIKFKFSMQEIISITSNYEILMGLHQETIALICESIYNIIVINDKNIVSETTRIMLIRFLIETKYEKEYELMRLLEDHMRKLNFSTINMCRFYVKYITNLECLYYLVKNYNIRIGNEYMPIFLTGSTTHTSTCVICNDNVSDITFTCEHQMCHKCLMQYINNSILCPFCRRTMKYKIPQELKFPCSLAEYLDRSMFGLPIEH